MLLLLAGCASGPEAPAFSNLGADASYVGAATCATCHGEIAEAYATHGMANASYPLTTETRIEHVLDEPLVDPHTGFAYRVIETPDGLAQEERQFAPDGAEVARLVRPMEIVVGSGDAARTYFARRGDRLVELPLTWYTQDGGRWDFSPGYRESNPRFGRTMPDGCMSCHNAVSEPVVGVEDAFASIPEGIGCERCHGPGSVHVEARLASDGPAEGPDPTIVNPVWLPLDLRLDVCSQCHLDATLDVYRQGETAYSFRPGRPLSAHEALFAVPGVAEGGDGVAVVSHAARMQASACFEATVRTEAPLECVTCHDPHRGFEARPPGAQSAACVTCHASVADAVPAALRAEHTAPTGCVSCHMPRVDADDAPHSSFTDHWIRVVDGPAPSPRPEVGRSGLVAPLIEADREGDLGGLYEGMAAVSYGVQSNRPDALARGAEFIRIALDRLDAPADWGDARFLLGVALLQAGRAPDAVGPLEQAVALADARTRPQRLETLARALADAGSDLGAKSRFIEAVSAQPRRSETRREHGRFLLGQGRLDRAEPELGEAARLDPWDAETRLLLGIVQTMNGLDPADDWREAVRLDPDLVGPLSAGVRVGETVVPLWTAPTVFGWPRADAVPPGSDAVVYSSSGTPLARGRWPGVARDLGAGLYVVQAGGAVRRVAVVRDGT